MLEMITKAVVIVVMGILLYGAGLIVADRQRAYMQRKKTRTNAQQPKSVDATGKSL